MVGRARFTTLRRAAIGFVRAVFSMRHNRLGRATPLLFSTPAAELEMSAALRRLS